MKSARKFRAAFVVSSKIIVVSLRQPSRLYMKHDSALYNKLIQVAGLRKYIGNCLRNGANEREYKTKAEFLLFRAGSRSFAGEKS